MKPLDRIRTVYALDLPGTSKAVLLALAWHCSPKDQCWPGIKLLARETGHDRKAIIRALTLLQSLGLIAVSRSKHQSNRYALFLPKPAQSKSPKRYLPKSPNGDTNSPLNPAHTCTVCHNAPSATGEHGKCLNCWRRDNQHKLRT